MLPVLYIEDTLLDLKAVVQYKVTVSEWDPDMHEDCSAEYER